MHNQKRKKRICVSPEQLDSKKNLAAALARIIFLLCANSLRDSSPIFWRLTTNCQLWKPSQLLCGVVLLPIANTIMMGKYVNDDYVYKDVERGTSFATCNMNVKTWRH